MKKFVNVHADRGAPPPRKGEKTFQAFMSWMPRHDGYFDEPPDPLTVGDSKNGAKDPEMQLRVCPCHLASNACDTCRPEHRLNDEIHGN